MKPITLHEDTYSYEKTVTNLGIGRDKVKYILTALGASVVINVVGIGVLKLPVPVVVVVFIVVAACIIAAGFIHFDHLPFSEWLEVYFYVQRRPFRPYVITNSWEDLCPFYNEEISHEPQQKKKTKTPAIRTDHAAARTRSADISALKVRYGQATRGTKAQHEQRNDGA
ncbi:MAG: hypothetical protein FWF45_00660 [Coriobacteriia bacterium]|nr:hypothetical protein [Coriobacteriia bacterium]